MGDYKTYRIGGIHNNLADKSIWLILVNILLFRIIFITLRGKFLYILLYKSMKAKLNFQGLIALAPGTCLTQDRTSPIMRCILARHSSNNCFNLIICPEVYKCLLDWPLNGILNNLVKHTL